MEPNRPLLRAGRRAGCLRPRALGKLSLGALLFAAAVAPLRPLSAQGATGWIVVSEPGEWSDNRALSVAVGTRLRVVGQAFHSSGIQGITVGGQPAQIRPAAGGVVDFEASLTVPTGTSNISLEARPTSGEPIRRTFALTATGSAPEGGGAAPAAVLYSPGSAAARSILPGLGQIYTKRPVLGVLFMGAGAGAAAFGLISKKTTVNCLAPLADGSCPAGQEHSRSEENPYLIAGLGGAAAIVVVAAIEAYTAAKRVNAEGAARTGEVPRWLAHNTPTLGVTPNGLQLGIRLTR